jgi:DNA modification methylase
MKNRQFIFEDHPQDSPKIKLDRDRFVELLWEIDTQQDMPVFKEMVAELKSSLTSSNGNGKRWIATPSSENSIAVRKDVLISELNQIIEARTLERARYYLKRLEKGIARVKTGQLNDINLLRWKEYNEIITDSLWVVPKRDSSGAHLAWYWGNFIPQIPHQLITRYTRKGDWVLDPFLGSGTTLIECRRLGRNGIGVELSEEVSAKASELIDSEENPFDVVTRVVSGDARSIDLNVELKEAGIEQFQLVIMHPPYHDIIRFSDDRRDLSNADTIDAFLQMFSESLNNLSPIVEKGRYLALVVGDKYSRGEWIPLGFQCMNEVLKRGFTLKSIIVKNFDETKAKRVQKQLWRYRALVGGFYIFKHEYIFICKKK